MTLNHYGPQRGDATDGHSSDTMRHCASSQGSNSNDGCQTVFDHSFPVWDGNHYINELVEFGGSDAAVSYDAQPVLGFDRYAIYKMPERHETVSRSLALDECPAFEKVNYAAADSAYNDQR
jgi:hypothetical protein